MSEEEKAMIEAVAQRIIVWAMNNSKAEVEFAMQTDKYAKAVLKRVNEIAQGAPFKVEINPEQWFGVWGTNGG